MAQPSGSRVTLHGKIMDSLGLKYMEGYGMPDFKADTLVFLTHLSFDIYYVRNFGEEDLLHRLKQDGLATVLVHPEGFVRTVQSHGLMKIPLTLLRKGMMNKVYDKFLCECKGKVEFKKYVGIYHRLKG